MTATAKITLRMSPELFDALQEAYEQQRQIHRLAGKGRLSLNTFYVSALIKLLEDQPQ